MVVVKFKADTNDADYVYGFRIFESNKWNEIKEKTKELFEREPEVSANILNSDIIWTSYSDWISCYEEREITNTEFETFKRVFKGYGKDITFGYFESPIDYYDDED